MPVFYDQLNRAIDIPAYPKRIISIVPSQTELLFYLGLDAEIAGVTKFCVHPEDKIRLVAKIGGTKQLNLRLIEKLQPDLIIANKEENEQSQVEELMARYPVWISDIKDLPSALDMIGKVGEITGKPGEAALLIDDIERGFNALMPAVNNLRVAYFIWRKPYMIAGTNTYIDAMLRLCGLTNVFEQDRYPETTAEELIALNPNVIMLSSEPYPFAQKHVNEFSVLLPRAKIILADGEMFSWYGNCLLHVPGYFSRLLTALL